jgi:hypothetical protein
LNIIYSYITINAIIILKKENYPLLFAITWLILFFGFSIYRFLSRIPSYSHYNAITILEEEKDKISQEFLVFHKDKNSNIKSIEISQIPKEINDGLKRIETVINNILQISIPIFFLSYVTITIFIYRTNS